MKLGYILVYVPDVAHTVAFYERAFGLARRFIDESGSYGEMETGGTALGFVAEAMAEDNTVPLYRNRPDHPPAAAEVGFVVENVGQAYRTALDAGAEPVTAPKQKPWGQTVAYVRDPNGFLVELCTAMTA